MRNGQRLEQLENEALRLGDELGLLSTRIEELQELVLGLSIRMDRLEGLIVRLLGGFCTPGEDLRDLVLENIERTAQQLRVPDSSGR